MPFPNETIETLCNTLDAHTECASELGREYASPYSLIDDLDNDDELLEMLDDYTDF